MRPGPWAREANTQLNCQVPPFLVSGYSTNTDRISNQLRLRLGAIYFDIDEIADKRTWYALNINARW